MPHVIVKMLAGRTGAQKAAVADAVTQAVTGALGCPESAVSVGIEDIAPDRWTDDVYTPDISGRWDTVYKKPGYEPS